MRRFLLPAAVVALLGVAATTASGDYFGEGATVVSASLARQELADDATQGADIAAGGRFVAFDTRATNFFADDDPDPAFDDGSGGDPVATDRRGGIFRRDLETGELVLVADGDLLRESDGDVLRRGAHNPSISADGRWVAFHTTQRLVPDDTDDPQAYDDVYLRDMSKPLCRPLPGCAGNPYTLVSRTDADAPLTYVPPSSPVGAGAPGSNLSLGTGISDDGTKVLFRTQADSDVGGAGQLFVRDVSAGTTRLITRVRAGEAGAGLPAGGAEGTVEISGDGTAVLWSGRNAGPQTRFQPGEVVDDRFFFYLWQRIADGAGAATRRVTGAADPDDPGCPPTTPVVATDGAATGPCYGPLQTDEQNFGSVANLRPAMSRDGFSIAFVTATPARGSGQLEGTALDLFVTSMRPGVSRKAATRELTREGLRDPAASAAITGVAMSPDGRYLALATGRTRFLLPALRVLGPLRTQPDADDLLLADLQAGTVERVLLSAGGGTPSQGIESALSVSDGAARIAFVSGARNLFVGDANERADAFTIARTQRASAEQPPLPLPPDAPVPEAVGEAVPDPPVLSVQVRPGKKTGQMELRVLPPAAGALETTISGRLPGKDGKRRANAKVIKLAGTKGKAKKRERITMTVSLSKARVTLLRKVRTLSTSAEVRWTPTDRARRALRRTVTVTFRVVATKNAAKKKTSKRRARTAR